MSDILYKVGYAANAAGAKEKWVEPFVANAKLQTASLGQAQPVVDGVLDSILENRETLVRISAASFVSIVSHLALNQEDQARLVYLATAASFSERMAVLDRDDAAAAKAKADNDQMWAMIRKLALELLEAAAKAAIPLLLAAL